MGFSQQESQLELFDVKGEAAPKPRAEYPGRLFFQARYDQLVLGAVGVVLGLTVIFAFGVERGKELVRSERMLLARQPAADAADAPAVRASAPQPGTETPATPAPAAPKPAAGAKPAVSPKPTATPTAVPKPKVRVVAAPVVKAGAEAKAGAKGSRYAVQVATFGQAQAAGESWTGCKRKASARSW